MELFSKVPICTAFSGGSRSPVRRGANPSGGANIRFCQIFQKNCMQLRNLWSVAGGGAHQPPPPPSTNGICHFTHKCVQKLENWFPFFLLSVFFSPPLSFALWNSDTSPTLRLNYKEASTSVWGGRGLERRVRTDIPFSWTRFWLHSNFFLLTTISFIFGNVEEEVKSFVCDQNCDPTEIPQGLLLLMTRGNTSGQSRISPKPT